MNHDSELLSKAIAHHCAQAFSQASANTAHGQIPSGLLSALIRQGILTSEEGLQRVEYVQHAHRRINRLLAIIPLLSPEQLPRAVAIARGFRNSNQRMLALGALLERMPELWDEFCQAKPGAGERRFYNQLWRLPAYLPDRFVPQMMALVGEFHCSNERNRLWQQLLPRVSDPSLLQEYLARVRQEEDGIARTKLLSAIAQSLPSVWPEALESLSTIPSDYQKYWVIFEIAPALPEAVAVQAWDVIRRTMDAEQERVRALVLLIPQLSEDFLPQAIAIAQTFLTPTQRVQAFIAIAPRQPKLWPKIWNIIDQLESEHDLSWLLRLIADLSTDSRLPRILDTLDRIEHPSNRFSVLFWLAQKHPELWPQALTALHQSEKEESERNDVLGELARVVPDAMLANVLKMTEILQFDYEQDGVISVLAPRLPKPLLREALEIVQTFRDKYERAIALAGLAKYQPELWSKLWSFCASIEKEFIRSSILARILPDIPDVQVPRCVELIKTLEGECTQLRFLCALAPKRLEYLDDTIQTVRSASGDLHAGLLCKLAPYRPELWDEVIELANTITQPEPRIHILSEVAQYRPELWSQIVQTIRLMDPAEQTKSSLLRYVASRLPEDLLLEAIKIAMSISNPHMRLAAVCPLAHREPKFAAKTIDSLPLQALRTTQKTYVLRWLTPVLPEEQLATAFSFYQSIEPTEIYERFDALCHLSQRQPDLWREVLALVRQQLASHSTHSDSMLGRLAVDLPARWIPTLRDLVESIEDPVLKASASVSLLSRLELTEIGMEEFERLMEIFAGGDRKTYLKSLPLMAPAILKLGGEKALNAISDRLKQNFNAAKYHPA